MADDDRAVGGDALSLIDRAILAEPVRQALGSGNAQIVEWHGERIAFAHFNRTSEGLYRLWGSARDPNQPEMTRSWSLVMKVTHPPEGDDLMADAGRTSGDWNYWKHRNHG